MKLSGFLIVAKDCQRAMKYYHDLFGLEMLQDNDGNMILSGGLVLQEEKYWRGFIGKDVIPQNNACESYIFVRITLWQNHRDELFCRAILYPHIK